MKIRQAREIGKVYEEKKRFYSGFIGFPKYIVAYISGLIHFLCWPKMNATLIFGDRRIRANTCRYQDEITVEVEWYDKGSDKWKSYISTYTCGKIENLA